MCSKGAPETFWQEGLLSLGIEFLGLLVEVSALLDSAEALDFQSNAGLLHCGHPWVLLSEEAALLAHDTADFVLCQLTSSQSSDCLCLGAAEHKDLCVSSS